AFLTSVPATSAGPRRYFCHCFFESWPQATVGSVGLVPTPVLARTALSAQFSWAYSAWSLLVASEAPLLADGEALAEGLALEVDDGEPDGDGDEVAFSASVTARP